MTRRGARPDVGALAAGVRERRARPLAQAISVVEERGPERSQLISTLYPDVGSASVVGLTGPPGAGKSTFVARLAVELRRQGDTVGILAIDPTSPFSGGAILGDRIRMQSHYTDPGVFIRSMATRGAMGGLAPATHDAIDILDAAGFDWVLVETVGVGQDEVDIVRSVDTVVVVTVPGLGDDIQAIKAGLMEIADVFVINKADRDGVDRTKRDLDLMLSMDEHPGWRPPIRMAVATRGEGVAEILKEVLRHRDWLNETGEIRKRRKTHLRLRIENLLKEKVLTAVDESMGLEAEVESGLARREDPYVIADRLFTGLLKGADERD